MGDLYARTKTRGRFQKETKPLATGWQATGEDWEAAEQLAGGCLKDTEGDKQLQKRKPSPPVGKVEDENAARQHLLV